MCIRLIVFSWLYHNENKREKKAQEAFSSYQATGNVLDFMKIALGSNYYEKLAKKIGEDGILRGIEVAAGYGDTPTELLTYDPYQVYDLLLDYATRD